MKRLLITLAAAALAGCGSQADDDDRHQRPEAAVLTWGTGKAIVFVQPSGSGARYGREGLEFWEHQGEVSVDFYGDEFVCTAP